MSSFLWNNTGGAAGSIPFSVNDDERSDLWMSRFNWSYQLRHPSMVREQYGFFANWSRPGLMAGDVSACPMNGFDNATSSGAYEAQSMHDTGSYRPWYLRGAVTDGSGSALAAANMDWFLDSVTIAPVYIGACVTDQNGFYSMPTIWFGLNHYAEVDYANGTLVGASVRTLQPAL